ncbi:hypothetical protein CK203_106584 [Vitis vinifera]|uniref:Uncharacterized protein n=1 Tax=Vitis vinifera TaxID=29760 RepID=A0A438CG72_VITVI|nr:hypothetical protein CK203_106584 [Vitis vinifera]
MSGVSASPPPTFFSLEGRPKTRSFCCHQPLSHRKLRFNSLEIGCRGGGLQRDRVVQCNSSTNPPPPGSGTDLPLCYTEFFFLDLGVKVPCFDGVGSSVDMVNSGLVSATPIVVIESVTLYYALVGM